MPEFTVVVTDHDFESLAVEKEVLGDVATVRDLSDAPQAEFAAAVAEADGVLNLRRTLADDSSPVWPSVASSPVTESAWTTWPWTRRSTGACT